MRPCRLPPPPEASAAAPPRQSPTRHQATAPLARRRHCSATTRQIVQHRDAPWDCRPGRAMAAPRPIAGEGLAPAGNSTSRAAMPHNARPSHAARRTTIRPRDALWPPPLRATLAQPNLSDAMPYNVGPAHASQPEAERITTLPRGAPGLHPDQAIVAEPTLPYAMPYTVGTAPAQSASRTGDRCEREPLECNAVQRDTGTRRLPANPVDHVEAGARFALRASTVRGREPPERNAIQRETARTACRHAQWTPLPRQVPSPHLTPAPSQAASRPNAMPYNARQAGTASRHAQRATSLPRRVPSPHLTPAPSQAANRPNAMPYNVRPAHARAATPSRPRPCRVRRPVRPRTGDSHECELPALDATQCQIRKAGAPP